MGDKQNTWPIIVDFLCSEPLAISVSRTKIPEHLRREGLERIEQRDQLADALGVKRTTIYEVNMKRRRAVALLYDTGLSGECWDAMGDGDVDCFKQSYRKRHHAHTVDLGPPNCRKSASVRRGESGAAHTELRLDDLTDPNSSLNEVLGNVGLYLPAQRIKAGADGHISATMRCHAASIEGVKLVVTCCTLALKRSPANTRSSPPDAKIDVEQHNVAGVPVTVERIASGQRPKVRVTSSKGAIGELVLPAELWQLLDAREGDEFECEMRIFLRDWAVVGTEDEASLSHVTGAPIEDVAMTKIRARFEERALSDDGSAILHAARVRLVAVGKPKD